MSDSPNQTTNDTRAAPVLLAVAYLHFILIIVPTVVLGIIIMVIWKEKKPTGLTPIVILYLAMAIFSILAALTYGVLWDISLITGIPFLGECETYPLYNFNVTIFFSFHAFIALVIGTAALFQFLVLRYGKKVSSKWVYIALLFLVITSISVSCMYFYGGNSTTIRGSNCRFVKNGAVTVGSWVILAYTVPLAMTIVFSVLTCYKVKHGIVQSSDDEKSLVTSIVQINTFNICSYIIFRLASVLLYFVGTRLLSGDVDYAAATVIISRNLNDASYPTTLISILVVHKGLRRMAAKILCSRLLCERSKDTRMACNASCERSMDTLI